MHILVDEARCSGCRACELACVARHDGRFGTAGARIRVLKIEAHGIDRPSVCRQCDDAPCVAACPVGALERREATGAVVLTAADCIVCPACADACPFDAVFVDAATGLPIACDLCDGDPACVKRCVTGALTSSHVRAPERPAFARHSASCGEAGTKPEGRTGTHLAEADRV